MKTFQSSVFSKAEVKELCQAYAIKFRQSDSKKKLAEQLVAKIRMSSCVPSVVDASHQREDATKTTTTSTVMPGVQQMAHVSQDRTIPDHASPQTEA